MKANEFVKKHGIKVVKNICDKYFSYTHVTDDARMLIDEAEYKKYAPHFVESLNDSVKIDDLKRLVESRELVEEYGGLDKAKAQAEKFRLNTCIKMHSFMCRIIADVESCK